MAPDEDVLDADGTPPAEDDVSSATTVDEAAQDAAASEEDERPDLDLQVEVDSTSACERHVTVTIAREDVERYFDEAFSELMPSAEVPGFRPGRAPRKLVENRFRKQVREQIKGSLLMDSMSQVSEEQDFTPISEPSFDLDAIEVPDEGPMTFEFDIEVRPEFDLPQWKGLRLERPVRQFTSADVDAEVLNLRRSEGRMAVHEGPAEPGDYLVVHMTFSRDGEQISRAEKQRVRVRPVLTFHDGRVDDFDKLMDGVKPGDVRSGKARISDEAPNEELRGSAVDVEINVLEVRRMELADVDPQFLERIGDFENEGELRDAILDKLNRQLEYRQRRSIREQITRQLTKTADFELPAELLRRQSQRELQRAILELRSAGFTEEIINAYTNELRQNSQATTATALKEHFILERIAEEHEIEDAPEDYDREIELIAAQSGDSPRRVRARLEKRGQMDALRNHIIEGKVIDLIQAEAIFDDVELKPAAAEESDNVFAVDFTISSHDDSDIPEAKHGGEAMELPRAGERT